MSALTVIQEQAPKSLERSREVIESDLIEAMDQATRSILFPGDSKDRQKQVFGKVLFLLNLRNNAVGVSEEEMIGHYLSTSNR